MNLLKLAPLLSKSPDELTDGDLATLSAQFAPGIQLTDELKQAALALLKDSNIHKVSDLIQSPESIKQLVNLVKPSQNVESNDERVIRCPHCQLFSIIKA